MDGTDLHNSINEEIPNDNTYMKSVYSPVNNTAIIQMSNAGTPNSEYPVKIRLRFQKIGTENLNLELKMFEGAIQRDSWTYSNVNTSIVTIEETISSVVIDNITDWDSITFRFTGQPAS